ncbi:hypothetical protein FFI97_019320 [Variovorax sp. KBS0712]|uniref:hypothetical protein n=1 Tax=Variovorax sp. KBS0712 TaxID=2578111 RepID=UPI001119EB70|nr:hypothetical protein [Variovorax sp. KBS0712]TSD56387.1 hypothetical protein FFI97_019320 [Variovorax sp. KBS0712]
MSTTPINPMAHLACLPEGVTVLFIPTDLRIEVVTAVVKEAATAGQNFGLKFPLSPIVNVLVSGTEREVQQARALHAGNALDEDAAEVRFVPVGLRKDVDYFSQEGLFFLQAKLRKERAAPETWVFEQTLDGEVDFLVADALCRLRVMAKATHSCVVAIIACDRLREETRIADLVDEFIKVEACEPDVDGGVAFSFDCTALQGLQHFGLGKVMCTLKFGEDFRYERTFAPFVAKSLLDRAIRTLHVNDYKMAAISEIVVLNKSNVSRRLDGWQPRRIVMAEGWPDQLKEYFAMGGGKRRAPIENSDDSESDDDDGDIEEEG